MPRVNKQGYIERKGPGKYRGKGYGINIWRNWWLIKYQHVNSGKVSLGQVYLPKEYIGKKVRFKIEIMKEVQK